MWQQGREEVLCERVHGDALPVDDLPQTAEGAGWSGRREGAGFSAVTTVSNPTSKVKHTEVTFPRRSRTFQQLNGLFPEGLDQKVVQLQFLEFGNYLLLIATHLQCIHTHTHT